MSAGAKLERSLLDGMKTSEGAVFFITDAYKDDKWIASEIDYAIAQTRERPNFIIIPIVYKERQKDPNPSIPPLLNPYLAITVTDKRDALLEILKRLGDERSRQVVQAEIPPTPPPAPRWSRLKRLLSHPALSHTLALLIGIALTAVVMSTTAQKQNEPDVPVIPPAVPPDNAAIAKDQRDKALVAFAEELDPKWITTSFSMNKVETGQWIDICKIDGPPQGTFYIAVVEVTRDVRIGDGTIEKDRKGKCFVFLSQFPRDLKALDAKEEGIVVEPPSAVFGSLTREMGKTMHLRIERNKQNHLVRHIFLRVTDVPAPSYGVTVKLYGIQNRLLDWYI